MPIHAIYVRFRRASCTVVTRIVIHKRIDVMRKGKAIARDPTVQRHVRHIFHTNYSPWHFIIFAL